MNNPVIKDNSRKEVKNIRNNF
jgi:hypothetical protein